jgi:hypothetical protein
MLSVPEMADLSVPEALAPIISRSPAYGCHRLVFSVSFHSSEANLLDFPRAAGRPALQADEISLTT